MSSFSCFFYFIPETVVQLFHTAVSIDSRTDSEIVFNMKITKQFPGSADSTEIYAPFALSFRVPSTAFSAAKSAVGTFLRIKEKHRIYVTST